MLSQLDRSAVLGLRGQLVSPPRFDDRAPPTEVSRVGPERGGFHGVHTTHIRPARHSGVPICPGPLGPAMGPGQALTVPACWRPDRRASSASAAAASIIAILALIAGPRSPALSSLVAGAGLAALAATDAATHRLPATRVNVLAGLTAVTRIGAAWWHDEWGPLLRAFVGAALLAVVLVSLWLALPGAFAFGDVKVTIIAFAAAAATSWRAGAVMIIVACVIGGVAAVIARGTRRHLAPVQPTIPFVPGLALGFVVGVMVPW